MYVRSVGWRDRFCDWRCDLQLSRVSCPCPGW